jgi:hypothetical protein
MSVVALNRVNAAKRRKDRSISSRSGGSFSGGIFVQSIVSPEFAGTVWQPARF